MASRGDKKRQDPKSRDGDLLAKGETQRRRDRANEQRHVKRDGAIAKRRRASPTPQEGMPEAGAGWSEDELKWALTGVMELPTGQVLPQLRKLRQILSGEDPPIEKALEAGVVPHLANLLLVPDQVVSLEAIWCLTNIASGTTEHTRPILDCAPQLISLLGGANTALQEQALWALGNIAADENADFRLALLANGTVLPVVRLISSKDHATARTAAWTLSNLARGHATSARMFAEAGAFQALLPLLASPDDAIALEAAWAMAFLTAREEECVDQLVKLGAAPLLVALLQRSGGREPLATPTLRALGNLSSGPDQWMAALLAQPALLPSLLTCLQADVTVNGRLLAKEAAWVASNLASGGADVRDALVSSGVAERLVELLQCGQFDVQREALPAVWNLVSDGQRLPQLAAAPGVLPATISLLRTPDALVVRTALSFLRLVCERVENGPQMVEKLGGLEAIDDLHYGQVDEALSSAAAEIVDTFFGDGYEGASVPLSPVRNEASAAAGGGGTAASEAHVGIGRGKQVNTPAWMMQQQQQRQQQAGGSVS